MKKLLCTLFALFLLLALPIIAQARDFTPEEGANTLYTLGLFQGTGTKANGLPDYHADPRPGRHDARSPARQGDRGEGRHVGPALHRS